jgi:hypothetical protein
MLVTAFAQAGLIPTTMSDIAPDSTPLNTGEVSQDSYIIYKDSTGKSWDIAWASDVNSELYFEGSLSSGGIFNTLFSADTHVGWTTMPFDETEGVLEFFVGWEASEIEELFIIDPTAPTPTYKHAFEYWNSVFSEPLVGFDFNPELIRSDMAFTWNDYKGTIDASLLGNNDAGGATFDTFYFRESNVQTGSTAQVPEPSTLMIFALGLIALASKKRLFS